MYPRSTLLAAAMLTLTTRAAHAQRPVITENLEEPGRAPYQSNKSKICTNGEATLEFDPVPDGKRLVVTYVSGLRLQSSSRPDNSSFLFLVNIKNFVQSPGSLYVPTVPGGLGTTVVAQPVTMYVEANAVPALTSYNCIVLNFSLYGYLVNIP